MAASVALGCCFYLFYFFIFSLKHMSHSICLISGVFHFCTSVWNTDALDCLKLSWLILKLCLKGKISGLIKLIMNYQTKDYELSLSIIIIKNGLHSFNLINKLPEFPLIPISCWNCNVKIIRLILQKWKIKSQLWDTK